MLRCPIRKSPGAFNAHNPGDGGSGLVQPVFRVPARIPAAESIRKGRQFFSLAEANAALAEKIEEWNNRPFAPPREGSRRSLFEAIERDKLKPLPAAPFVVGQWLVARVNIDYHVAVDGHFYSVPYRLVHRRLDVFLTATAVAIFHQGERSPVIRAAPPRRT